MRALEREQTGINGPERSAKPLCAGSIPARASNSFNDNFESLRKGDCSGNRSSSLSYFAEAANFPLEGPASIARYKAAESWQWISLKRTFPQGLKPA
jgi:hypothetical protein